MARSSILTAGGVAASLVLAAAVFPAPAVGQADSPRTPGESALRSSRNPQVGDVVVVVYRDGRRLDGLLARRDARGVGVTVSGIEVSIAQEDIERVYRLGTPMERYFELRDPISDDDAQSLVGIARWAMAHGLEEVALVDAKLAVRADPRDSEALSLVHRLEKLVALKERAASGGRDGDARGGGPAAGQEEAEPLPVLSPREINLIKVYELDLDNLPRLQADESLAERLLADYAHHELIPTDDAGREAFRRLPAERLIEVMFRVRARELYNLVEVVGHPASMQAFREHVQVGILARSCASTRCHGGVDAGELRLVNKDMRGDAATYTNYLILDRFRTSWGESLLNWEEPSASVLLQMGLPRDKALWPHPEVAGWRPIVMAEGTGAWDLVLKWMDMMYTPRPTYPVEYPPRLPGQAVEPEGDGADDSGGDQQPDQDRAQEPGEGGGDGG